MTDSNEPREGEVKCWGFVTGAVNPLLKASRQAVDYIAKQQGFLAVHLPTPDKTLWVFDTENNAKMAKNLAEANGIICGREVVSFFVEKKYLKEAKDRKKR